MRSTLSRWVYLTVCVVVALLPLLAAARTATPVVDQYWLDLEPVADGFNQPVDVVDPGDGSGRLFVVERGGLIRIITDGQVLPTPFLDLAGQVSDTTWEQGLFSVAFDPDYAHSGVFYVASSPTPHEWRLTRYHVSDDPNRADSASATTLISFQHPGETHYAGQLLFGPDGYLWISVGDGGGAYNPYGTAQDLGTLLGKILRIDVAHGEPYAIPPDNPFVNTPGARAEIWAYGLRNPWRFTFDRATGDLYIGDVGEGHWEEVDTRPAGDPGGENYGWPLMEGMQCSQVAPDCDPARYTLPIAQYTHDEGCAVTGGYVYRGDPASPLWGTYVFGDYCRGELWTARPDAGQPWQAIFRARTPLQLSSFGQDAAGELYLTDFLRGVVYHLVARSGALQPNLQRVQPASVVAGGAGCDLPLEGSNFQPDAQVTLDGAPRPTTWVDGADLRFTLSADDLAQPGQVAIAVQDSGGGASQAVTLTIAGSAPVDRSIYDRWARDDLPVVTGAAGRTWLWGPAGRSCPMLEPYADAPGGQRVVQYFDKSRMEISDQAGDPNAEWHVTNGLLAKELITGALQTGDATYEQRAPAEYNVAGDQEAPDAPTYASFTALLDAPPASAGAALTQRVDRAGVVADDPTLASYGVTAAELVTVPGIDHQVASVFWDFLHTSGTVYQDGAYVDAPLFANPFYATGYPITEAYWATVTVAGTPKDVLTQCFERRCLTWTPGNPPGWQVEAGNVGEHYYRWRYGG